MVLLLSINGSAPSPRANTRQECYQREPLLRHHDTHNRRTAVAVRKFRHGKAAQHDRRKAAGVIA